MAGQTFTVTQAAGMAVPVCTVTASASTINLGSSVILTATCSPAATSYTWTPAAGLVAGPANTATVTPTAAVIYQYSVTGINASGVGNTASTSVTVTAPAFNSQSDCLLNWAERTYLNWFAPAGAISNTLAPYYYRYYLQTNAYLGTSSADNHLYYFGPLSNYSVLDLGALVTWSSVAGCGGTIEQEVIKGQVIDGYIQGALVCIDLNYSGQCDNDEPQTWSDSAGGYQLSIPKGSTAPLIAEIIAGQSRDSDLPGTTVDVSYRMASPSSSYSTNITPFSTLVQLSAESNFPLAEDLVRNELGLPPKFALNMDSAAAPGSLTQAVTKSVVIALKATAATINLSSVDGLNAVVAALPPGLTSLPILRITTTNRAPIVSKEVYIDATFSLTNPAISDTPVLLNGKIRGRGHITWGQPKSPYKIQFTNDASYANISDVVGMQKSRRWELLADYFDRSLLRNKLAYSLGNSSVFADGLKWTPSGQHLEVYLNEDYVGVYLLTQGIRIDPDRLNLKQMSTDPAANDLDGGYIVEVDAWLDCYNQGGINLQHRTPQGVPICINTPDETQVTPMQQAYIKTLLDGVEQDIYGQNRLEKINPASFVDWYLINELFRNNDAVFFSSVFMWKDTEAASNPLYRLLNMGPIWDFDISAGNINYNDNWRMEGCWVSKTPSGWTNWITKLFDNADFLNLTLARWKQQRPALEKFINSSIDTYSRRLELPQQRNFARWPIFGVPLYNYYVFSTYADEVAFLKRFLNERMAWLDIAYASPANFNALCK